MSSLRVNALTAARRAKEKRPHTRSPFRTGDFLIDWFFCAIIYSLNEQIEKIIWVHNLHDINKRGQREKLDGLTDDNIIFLEYNLSSERGVKVLIHEVCHVFIELGVVEENYILQIEDYLSESFTSAQKNLIESFLPKKR
ncbi:MAG: hypothetical protein WCW78_01150 [Candidatus Paceibacterota bacterium]|jgi:hypothetical protein